jgi:hypothetical protein
LIVGISQPLRGPSRRLIYSWDAPEALKAARAAGIQLGIEGDDLVLEAPAAPPPSVLDLLARHKAGVVALLRPANDGWSAEDWLAFFEKRATIAELDCGLPRAEAVARALDYCAARWLTRNPVCSSPGCCLGCGGSEQVYDTLLPFGTDATGCAWLHSRCWSAWYERRKAEAFAARSWMGIPT